MDPVKMNEMGRLWAASRGIQCGEVLVAVRQRRVKRVSGYEYPVEAWRWRIGKRASGRARDRGGGLLLVQAEVDEAGELRVLQAFLLPDGEARWRREIELRDGSSCSSWLRPYRVWP